MKKIHSVQLLLFVLFVFSCKKQANSNLDLSTSKIKYAKGFVIEKHQDFSIIKVTNPWPNTTKSFTYVLAKKNAKVPDSLSVFPVINIPISTIIATSTTHIPSLEMLGVENTLVGFPGLNYISSPKIRNRINQNKVREIGNNQSINTEVVLDIAPSIVVGYGIDDNNTSMDNLQKSGLKIMFNGDWNEESPLGKAEWIKFFGALYGLETKADSIFSFIENEYLMTKKLAATATTSPSVLAGAMYQDQWFMPKGNSWGSLMLKDAKCNYIWGNTKGTGSLNLSFETVLSKSKTADFWIQGQFSSLAEVVASNAHYTEFDCFKNKQVFSFGSKKGATGGVLYYELAPNRPDLVLKDLVKIFHPELLPSHKFYFLEQLK